MLKAKKNLITYNGKSVAVCNTNKEAKYIVKTLIEKLERDITEINVNYNKLVRRYVIEVFNGQWWEIEMTSQLLEEIQPI